MKNYLNRLTNWIDGRNLRDRSLLFGISIILFALLAHRVFLQAPLAEELRLNEQISRELAETAKIHADITQTAGHAQIDPDAEKNAQLKKLMDEEATAADVINNLRRDLMAPGQMLAMLDTILARQGTQLQLVSLTKLPLQTLNPARPGATGSTVQAAGAASASPGLAALPVIADPVYKHGVEIVVKGSYFDLLNYLAELEKMSSQVSWGKLELATTAYPKSTMTIQLFTLSLDKKWMNL